jgi:hypothetical protein
VFGLFSLVLISITYLHSTRDAKNASQDLILLFGLIAFFGLVVDVVHSLAAEDGYLEAVLGVVEDGGEMFRHERYLLVRHESLRASRQCAGIVVATD